MVSTDVAAMSNPYDVLWDTDYRGNMAILDDWHTAMAMVLLRNGIYDINTTDPEHIAMVREQLLDMRHTMKPRVTIGMYTELPAGQYGLCQMWSGDAINLPYYLPEKTSTDVLRYWFPEELLGRGRQRPGRVPGPGEEPGGRHVPQRAARREGGRDQPRLHRLPAALQQFTPESLVADGLVPEEPRHRWCGRRTSTPACPAAPAPGGGRRGVTTRSRQEFKAGG